MRTRLQGSRILEGEETELAGRGNGPRIDNAQGLNLSEGEPTEWLRQILPMEVVTVPAGGVATSTVAPQEIFKVRKVNIPDVGVAGVFCTDIKVGQLPQFVNGGQVDVRNFIPDAVSTYVDFDTGKVGNVFSMAFQNTTLADVVLAPMCIALIAV